MDQNKLEYCISRIEEAVQENDDEVAHSREDNLRALFIESLLDDPKYSEQAKRVLSTNDMKFARWCA